jgi:hypothetical protein
MDAIRICEKQHAVWPEDQEAGDLLSLGMICSLHFLSRDGNMIAISLYPLHWNLS